MFVGVGVAEDAFPDRLAYNERWNQAIKEIDVLSDRAKQVASKAKQIYRDRLRERLESSDHGRFVCIEPESGDYYVGDRFDEAVNQAIDVPPKCLTHTLRIGHAAALHLGVLIQ